MSLVSVIKNGEVYTIDSESTQEYFNRGFILESEHMKKGCSPYNKFVKTIEQVIEEVVKKPKNKQLK